MELAAMDSDAISSHSLVNLHPELQLYIVDRLERFRDLASLILTCKTLQARLSPVLYRIANRVEPDLLHWLCSRGGAYKAAALQRLLDIGTDPARVYSADRERGASGLFGEHHLQDTSSHFESGRHVRKWISRGEMSQAEPRPFNGYTDELGRRLCEVNNHCGSDELPCVISEYNKEGMFHIQWSAIHVAASKGHMQILEVFLDYDSKHNNKLINSLASGYCKITDMLPARMRQRHRLPDNIEAVSERSQLPQALLWTLHPPLRAALFNRQQDAAKLLIERGAKVIFEGPDGQKEHALHVAARYSCHKIIKYLNTKLGVDLNIQDHTGWTPLCEAIVIRTAYGSVAYDTVTYLIDLGADVNASLGQDGFTHLHLACYRRQWTRALTLLEAGANVEAIWTPKVDPTSNQQSAPCRAIDLICTDTFSPEARFSDCPPERTNASHRHNLLTRLIETYKASTSPCPGAQTSPLALAATRSRVSTELLKAFVKAQVYFHNDTSIVQLVISSPAAELGLGPDYTEGNVIAVARYLVRHGARVGSTAADNEVLAKGIHRLLAYVRPDKRKNMWNRFSRFLELLISKAGMDPDIPAMKTSESGELVVDRERNLLRVMLCERGSEFSLAIIPGLTDAGATVPGVMDFLKDWCEILPGLADSEVAEYKEWRGKGFPEKEARKDIMEKEAQRLSYRIKYGSYGSVGVATSSGGSSGAPNRVASDAMDGDESLDEEDEQNGEDDEDDEDEGQHDDDDDISFSDMDNGADAFQDLYTDESDDDDDDDDDSDAPGRDPPEAAVLKTLERELKSMQAIFLRTFLLIGPKILGENDISPENIYHSLLKDLTMPVGSENESTSGRILMEADELERWRREASHALSKWLKTSAVYLSGAVMSGADVLGAWDPVGACEIMYYCRRIRAGKVG